MTEPRPTLLSWSSGKDSAWALHCLNESPDYRVCALITTFNTEADRVAMHAVRRSLVQQQAEAAGLPLIEIELPWPCPNAEYEQRFGSAVSAAAERFAARHIAFGDLFLDDIRGYRERQMTELNLEPVFPLWGEPTDQLARSMLDGGLCATITCVDPRQLDAELAGCRWDQALVQALPDSVDPCGENGEFHTFTWAGPMFAAEIGIRTGERVDRDGFRFADVLPA